MKSLSGKTALITGGSRGIGAAIVRRFASEGARVAFTYGQSKAAAEKLAAETGAKAYAADAADLKKLPQLVQSVMKDFGALDILVNNAGVFSGGVIGEIPQEEYERVMRVNADSIFVLTNTAVKEMKAGSRIINISSILGQRACDPGLSVYNTSKFAVIGMTRSWAKDLGTRGITVNAILPGPVDTDMNPDSGEFAEQMKKNTALGRYGRPEEIAGAALFLAGPDAVYVTGALLNVDGGYNA